MDDRRLVVSEEEADDDGRLSLLVFAGYMNSTERARCLFRSSQGGTERNRGSTSEHSWVVARGQREEWMVLKQVPARG
jgi:hypothetical protein